MNKKVIAISVALLMIFSVFAVITPAKAVTPTDVSVFLSPGREDPYHPGWSQTLGTLWNNPEEVTNKYLEYAILASTKDSASIGDLQFTFTLESPFTGVIVIYLPPEFEFTKDMTYSVWTDITNDYNYIQVSTMTGNAAYGPGWNRIRIGRITGGPWTDADPTYADGTTLDAGTYHVRVFALKAPTQAGVYHFKIGMNSPWTGAPDFDPMDYPIIIVKDELNPAYVTGTVFACADFPCTTGTPGLYGKVWAEGTTPEGREVSSVYYFGPEDDPTGTGAYTYWLFGVAPGTYTLMASATGHPKATGERFDVVAGQSTHLKTMYLGGGTAITVTVWSKHGRGELPWGSLWQPPYGTNDPSVVDLGRPRPILLELFDADGNYVFESSGDTDPLATSFTTVLGPNIGWTASIPAESPWYIDGFAGGAQYTLEAHVTGYVMTEDDAWQRTFTVTGDQQLQIDLRRSNYFSVQVHMGTSDLPTVPSTLVLAALDADGKEKGVNSLVVDSLGDLWFWDSGYADYGPQVNPNTGLNYNVMTDPIILEGWSHRYRYTEYESSADYRDYGLEPGTYDIALYMADMGDQTGRRYGLSPLDAIVGKGWYTIREDDPHTGSIALCNSASMLSFRVRLNSLTLTIRSVDWESPARSRPWSFPGAEIGLEILDMDGNVVEKIDNSLWGIVQDDGTIGTYYAFNDDDAVNPPCFDPDPAVCPPNLFLDRQLTVVYTGNDPGIFGGWKVDAGLPIDYIGYYPTHLAAGQYQYALHTYGYVERRVFPNVLTLGGNADIQADLIQGGQIRVYMDFYKEAVNVDFGVIDAGWVRIEVFNENDELVGASVYGMADPNPLAMAAGIFSYQSYDPLFDYKKVNTEPGEGAGNDQAPEFGYGQRAYTSSFFYGAPGLTFANYIALNPVDAHSLIVPAGDTAASDVFGFYWYFGDPSSRNEGLWANGYDTTNGVHKTDTGLRGSTDQLGIDGGGLYKVKVWAFDPSDWQSYFMGADVTGVEVPWGGFTDVWVHLNQLARLTGSIGWIDMYGNMRNMPWLQVTASGPETVLAYTTPTVFGPESFMTSEPAYMMWLPAGSYDLTAEATVAPQVFDAPSLTVSVSPGFSTAGDMHVTPTGVPVPEFTIAPLVALSALAASLYVLKRRRK